MILDTFDILSPYYDKPMTEAEEVKALREADVEAVRLSNPGLNLAGERIKNGA